VNPQARFALALTLAATALAVAATFLLVGPLAAATPAAGGSLTGEAVGWGLLSAALATAASSIGAGLAVGRLGAAAIGALAEKPELFGRLLIFVGLAEGIAIYGLIVSILILNRLA